MTEENYICKRDDCIFSTMIKCLDYNKIPCCNYILYTHESVQQYRNYETGECERYIPADDKAKKRLLRRSWKRNYDELTKIIRDAISKANK